MSNIPTTQKEFEAYFKKEKYTIQDVYNLVEDIEELNELTKKRARQWKYIPIEVYERAYAEYQELSSDEESSSEEKSSSEDNSRSSSNRSTSPAYSTGSNKIIVQNSATVPLSPFQTAINNSVSSRSRSTSGKIKSAAKRIQKVVRGRNTRKKLKKQSSAAKRIQKIARGRKTRKNLPRLIRDKKDSMMFNLPIVPSTPNPIIPPPVVSTIQPAISMPMQPMPAPKPLAIDDVSSDIPMLDVNQYEKIKRNAKKRRQKRKTRKAKKTPFDNKSKLAKRRLSKTKKRIKKLRQSALNKKRMERNMIRQQKRQSDREIQWNRKGFK